MATVQIADIYEPTTFNQGVDEATTFANRFYQAGIMVRDSQLDALAAGAGRITEVPFYKQLEDVEPNYSNDDPDDVSTPQKMGGGVQVARKVFMNQSWSAMDMARELALKDPLDGLVSKIGTYWATQMQRRTIQSLVGVLEANKAQATAPADMVFSVATDAALPITAGEKISGDVVLAAKQTVGDAAGVLTSIALHSALHTQLQTANLIEYVIDPVTGLEYQTYLGYRVIIDDALPAVMGTNRITFTSVLFGAGALSWGFDGGRMPSEVTRKAESGKGSGQEIVFSRRQDIIHPSGFAFTSSAVVGESPTLAELADPDNWKRVYERKSIALAFIQTN